MNMLRTDAKLVIIGQGYVGLPVAMRAVEAGFEVVGFDRAGWKVDRLRAADSYIDDVTDAHLAAALATGRYTPSGDEADLAHFDVAVITVPTPLRDGAPDLSFIEAAGRDLAPHIGVGSIVILESTTYPGTTDELLLPILEAGSGLVAGRDFHLGFSPERIDPGNQQWNFRSTPKIVSGIDEASLKAIELFYDRLVDTTVPVSGTREAEFTKLLENTYRFVNVALVNELAVHAHTLGVDIWEVIRAASTKPFGFTAFWPGPGVGGHCLPIDPAYLAWQIERRTGVTTRFIETANDVNRHMPQYVVQRVMLGLNDRSKSLKGARVIVVGAAYKKNSNDARDTPASAVVEGLAQLGALVQVHDPHVEHFEHDELCERIELTCTELQAADAVVIVTDHDVVDYARIARHADYVLDTRNCMSGTNVELL
jgi:nucleotide sugar dehydrogenase